MAVLPDDVYVGESIACLIKATDPTLPNAPAIRDLDCNVEFFVPGKSPKSVPADRTTPDADETLEWDEARGGYFGLVSTAGWADGTWSFRVVLTGTRVNWSFGTIKIKP